MTDPATNTTSTMPMTSPAPTAPTGGPCATSLAALASAMGCANEAECVASTLETRARASLAAGTSSGDGNSFAAHAKALALNIRLSKFHNTELKSRAVQVIADWPRQLK